MDNAPAPLLLVLCIGLLARNRLVAAAATLLLLLRLAGFTEALRFLSNRSLELGLVLLTVAVLAPLAVDQTGLTDLGRLFTTLAGWLAIVGGAVATCVNGQGIGLLRDRPEVIGGLLVGTIIGVVVLRGIPVGPLTAAGVTALLLRLFGK
ncbi:MAG TPA: DUF441 domain-containing protein [Firmicutes bacterium]|nr:DUF441 domain-containing protein [Bacillota bacterium]